MDSLQTTNPTLTVRASTGRADQHPVAVYLARLSPGSRRAMRQALEVIAGLLSSGKARPETLRWDTIRYQHTQAVRACLADRYAPATANKALSALRGVLGECFRLGLVSAEDHTRATDLPGVKGQSAPRGRALKTGELVALFGACDATTAQGARDAGLLAVLYGAGLRRAEVVALDVADFDLESGELRIRSGKGRKARTVWVTNGARDALKAWLEVRGDLEHPRCGIREPSSFDGRQLSVRLLQADKQVHSRGVNGCELVTEHLLDAVAGARGRGSVEGGREDVGPSRQVRPLLGRVNADDVRLL